MTTLTTDYPSTAIQVVAGETYTLPQIRRTTVFEQKSTEGDKKHPNPYSFTSRDTTYMRGSSIRTLFTKEVGSYTDTFEGNLPGMSVGRGIPPTDIAEPGATYFNEVSQKALTKIYDQIRGGGALSIDLIEGAKTARMVVDALKLHKVIANFLTSFAFGVDGRVKYVKKRAGKRSIIVHDRLSSGQSRLDYMSSKWLEYRYGWQPTVSSIYTLLDQLGTDLQYGSRLVKGRASKSYSKDTTTSSGSVNSAYLTRGSYRIEYGLNFSLDPSLQIHDWTSFNPVVIGYELLTLSFVVEWFVKIGQCLSLWENYWIYHKAFRGGYRTISELRVVHQEQSFYIDQGSPPLYPTPGVVYAAGPYTGHYEGLTVFKSSNRSVLNSLPTPGVPVVKTSLNIKKFMDTATLTHQLLAKKMR